MSRRSVRGGAVSPPAQAALGGGWSGAGALLGFVLMVVAVYLPFAHITCQSCPLITSTNRASGDLLGGVDGWRVLVLAIAGVVTAASFALLVTSRRQTALGSLVLALAAGALVIVDGVNATTRVLGWPSPGLSVAYGAGFYLALVGAIAALVFSLLMVASQRVPRS